jgi:hypothetical protein
MCPGGIAACTTRPALSLMYSPPAGSGLGTGAPAASRYMALVRAGGVMYGCVGVAAVG